jgi:hypothetical protein
LQKRGLTARHCRGMLDAGLATGCCEIKTINRYSPSLKEGGGWFGEETIEEDIGNLREHLGLWLRVRVNKGGLLRCFGLTPIKKLCF